MKITNKYKNCSFEYFSKIKLTMTVLLLDMASVRNIFVLIVTVVVGEGVLGFVVAA